MMLALFLFGVILGTVNNVAAKKIHPEGRIAGGQDADIADYPYQVSLSTDGLAFCGGSLISSTWVLTCAHCLKNITAAQITVLANSSHINDGVKRSVSQAIPHENFCYDTGDSDLALLQLSSPLECVNCKPITLARKEPKVGDYLVLTGWGRISEFDTSDGTEILQYVEIPVIDRTVCRAMYSHTVEIITDNMICSLYPGGGKDSCVGDSGGPAVVDDVLFGVVSWGIGCADAQYPGVYTSVPKFLEWIEKHTGLELN
ncbi:trypsin Blo t 3 [Leptinotarsa decemlineata]|uniref:trypsin Blo t 3 n=1 Tax=Leptinotarsa decemlineata TaxID=7539 RepID=UPI003D305D39